MLSPASIADRTMIGRSARALISRARRQAVHPRHQQVDDQQVRPGPVEPAERLVAVAGGRDVEAVVAELLGERHEQARVVVDEQDPRARRAQHAREYAVWRRRPRRAAMPVPGSGGPADDYGVMRWTGLPRIDTCQVVTSLDVPVPVIVYLIFHQPVLGRGVAVGDLRRGSSASSR